MKRIIILALAIFMLTCEQAPNQYNNTPTEQYEQLTTNQITTKTETTDSTTQNDSINKDLYILIWRQNDQELNEFLDYADRKGFSVQDSCNCIPKQYLLDGTGSTASIEQVAKGSGKKVRTGVAGSGQDSSALMPDISMLLFTEPTGSGELKDEFQPIPSSTVKDTLLVAIIDGYIDQSYFIRDYSWSGTDHNPNRSDTVSCPTQFDSPVPSYSRISGHGNQVQYSLLYTMRNYQDNASDPFFMVHDISPNDYALQILNVPIFDTLGNSTLFQGMCAVRYAASKGVDAIITSWGFQRPTNLSAEENQMYDLAIDEFSILLDSVTNATGTPIIAAAGNYSRDVNTHPFYPAYFADSIPFIIGVGAIKSDGTRKNYSNHGEDKITLGCGGSSHMGNTAGYQGTSFAAPKAALWAAILRSDSPFAPGTTGVFSNRLESYKQQNGLYSQYDQPLVSEMDND